MSQKSQSQQSIKNRIVGSGMLSPKEIKANAKNWRKHPKTQRDALDGVLKEVGWVQEVIINKITGCLVDGHLRVSLALERKEREIPVKYVELTESEEALVLATIDPVAAMAETDALALDALLRDVSTGEAAVQQMLADLTEKAGMYDIDAAEMPEIQVHDTSVMTFTLTAQQKESLDAALGKAEKHLSDDIKTNKKAALLTIISEAYLES